jgi:hypothetical protein
MSAQNSFMDRSHWRQTRNGNFVREMGPFMVFLFRRGGSDKWTWSIRSNEAQTRSSMSEAKFEAYAGFVEAANAIVKPKPTGRFKTVDPFVLPDDAEMSDV